MSIRLFRPYNVPAEGKIVKGYIPRNHDTGQVEKNILRGLESGELVAVEIPEPEPEPEPKAKPKK